MINYLYHIPAAIEANFSTRLLKILNSFCKLCILFQIDIHFRYSKQNIIGHWVRYCKWRISTKHVSQPLNLFPRVWNPMRTVLGIFTFWTEYQTVRLFCRLCFVPSYCDNLKEFYDVLVYDSSIPSALAMEVLQPCTKPSSFSFLGEMAPFFKRGPWVRSNGLP